MKPALMFKEALHCLLNAIAQRRAVDELAVVHLAGQDRTVIRRARKSHGPDAPHLRIGFTPPDLTSVLFVFQPSEVSHHAIQIPARLRKGVLHQLSRLEAPETIVRVNGLVLDLDDQNSLRSQNDKVGLSCTQDAFT